MNTTAAQLTHAPPQSAPPRPIAQRRPGSASPDLPTWGELFDESARLLGVPAFFGPPIIFVLGPWLLLVLLLIGPFLLLVTFALTALVLVAVTAAILAPPYLLVRCLGDYRTRRPSRRPLVNQLRKRHAIGPRSLARRHGARLIDSPAAHPRQPRTVTTTHTHLTSEGI
jgi:hypothetical protein